MDLKVESVSFRYPTGVLALDGISLTIKAGETLAIVGENGAGKSTLAKHLNALLLPERGRVMVGDWNTREHTTAQLAARVGYAFQNPDDQLFAPTVGEEVAFGPRNLGFEKHTTEVRVAGALAKVGLQDFLETHPYDLPMSQRKLVVIAAILAMDTPVVLLDEPTIGQDGLGIAKVGQIVDELGKEDRTVIVISHDLDFCAERCSRVVVMSGGRIKADGPAWQVLYQVDLLQAAAVDAPQIARLAMSLGYTEEKPLEVCHFVDTVAKHTGT